MLLARSVPVQGRKGSGAATAAGTNRRLLSSLTLTTAPRSTAGTAASSPSTNSKRPFKHAPPPSCPPGSRLLAGRFVPVSEDCNAGPKPAAGPTSSIINNAGNVGSTGDYSAFENIDPSSGATVTYVTDETPVKVCSDAFETTAGALGVIYLDGALSQVLALPPPAHGGEYHERMLEQWPVANASLQAFHVQCNVGPMMVANAATAASGLTAAGSDGARASAADGTAAAGGGSGVIVLGDQCRVMHWDSGLCVVDYDFPGQLMADDCSRELAWGFMWRFCSSAPLLTS